jgi:hypothetical protein
MTPDPSNPCCQIPTCNFTAPFAGITGQALVSPTTHIAFSTAPPTPGFGESRKHLVSIHLKFNLFQLFT